VDRDALRAFVVDAHRDGYATSDAEPGTEPGENVIGYRDGGWRYVDRYSGSRAFAGVETVFRDGAPVWTMYYGGAPTDDAVCRGQFGGGTIE